MVALFLVNKSLSECIVSYYSALRQVSAKMVGSSYPAVPGYFHLAMPDFYFIFLTFHQVEISFFLPYSILFTLNDCPRLSIDFFSKFSAQISNDALK